MIIGNKGITLIVGILFVATALVAYNAPLSGNEKVTVALVGTVITAFVADTLKRRLYGESVHRDDFDDDQDQSK